MRAGGNGLPDKTQISTFISTASNPVDLETGPNGDLFYVDFEGGNIHRVTYASGNQAPTAVIGATPASGPSPLLVNLDGTGSTDPEGSALTYAWDLDDDGQYDDSTAAKPTVTFTTAGTHTVRLRVTDAGLATGTASRPILVDDALPTPVIDTPGGRADVEGRRHDLVHGPRDRRPGQRPARERPVVGAGDAALPVELPHPLDPVLDRRRGRLLRRARPRLPLLSRADPDGHRRVEPPGEHDAPPRPADGQPDVPVRTRPACRWSSGRSPRPRPRSPGRSSSGPTRA